MELKYKVMSTRTGGFVAAFLLKEDAQEYAEKLEKREGPHGVVYEVITKE